MLEIFTSVARADEKPDWVAQMESDFQSVRTQGHLDTLTIQYAMNSAAKNIPRNEDPEEGLKRFLFPSGNKTYCGLDRLSWYNKVERLFPDCCR